MKSTSTISNSNLIANLKEMVCEERRLTALILEYLREVEVRKIYLEMGYASLFEFCVKELSYSEGAAQRRISAMRLIHELPEIKHQLVSGDLSLTVLSQTQTYFKKRERENRPVEKSEKLELLSSLKNSSSRECEKTLIERDPQIALRDRERRITDDLIELRMTVPSSFMNEVQELKNLLSHSMPFASTQDILILATKELLARKKRDRLGRPRRAKTRTANAAVSRSDVLLSVANKGTATIGVTRANASSTRASASAPAVAEPSHVVQSPPRRQIQSQRITKVSNVYRKSSGARHAIPLNTRRAVWRTAGAQCTYRNSQTGRRCSSRKLLEIDHILPVSRSGSNALSNLTLLCDAHNRWKGSRVELRKPIGHGK